MGKYKAILLALFTVSALSAVAISSASAHQWLFKGEPIITALSGLLDGLFIIHHTGGLTGSSSIHCTGQFHGTFGPGSKDLITDVLGLSGSELADETHEGPIHCEFLSGTCGVGALALFFIHHLPWETKLLLTGVNLVWDTINKDGTHGEPGYEVECDRLKIVLLCQGLVRTHFDENLANGALFLLLGAESLETSCNDGGKGLLLGMAEVLGFTVS
jgi:hypothetical protein